MTIKVITPVLPHCAGQAVSGFIGTAHADIGFLSAQGLARRSTNEVVMAVIDTGLHLTHPDIVSNLWANPREIPNNGLDNDDNGDFDDMHGYVFDQSQFMIGDAYSYHNGILQTIEHAPEKNIGIADYCAVTYFYSLDRPNLGLAIPNLKARQVVDPGKMTFSPHWNLPISSFCLADATLGRKSVQIGDKPVRCLSLRPKGNDFFGPPFITFVCAVPAGGRYRVLIDAISGPDCGKVRLLQDASGQDHTVDLYAETLSRTNGMLMGEVEAQEGNNNLMFSVVAKNSASSALGFDLINIILEKVPASSGAQRP